MEVLWSDRELAVERDVRYDKLNVSCEACDVSLLLGGDGYLVVKGKQPWLSPEDFGPEQS